jgi:hypothetical protein
VVPKAVFEEDSSVLVYYIEMIGKTLVMCQSSMLPTPKGKGVSVYFMKAYGKLEEKLPSIRNFGCLYDLAFFTLEQTP